MGRASSPVQLVAIPPPSGHTPAIYHQLPQLSSPPGTQRPCLVPLLTVLPAVLHPPLRSSSYQPFPNPSSMLSIRICLQDPELNSHFFQSKLAWTRLSPSPTLVGYKLLEGRKVVLFFFCNLKGVWPRKSKSYLTTNWLIQLGKYELQFTAEQICWPPSLELSHTYRTPIRRLRLPFLYEL